MSFSTYWGVVIFLLPFFFRFHEKLDLIHTKFIFFVFASFLSVLAYGLDIKRLKQYPLNYIVILALNIYSYFNLYNENLAYSIYYLISVNLASIVALQFLSRPHIDYRKFEIALMGILITATIWTVIETFSIDPYLHLAHIVENKIRTRTSDEAIRLLREKHIQYLVKGPLGNGNISGALMGIIFPIIFRFRMGLLMLLPASFALYSLDSSMTVLTAICGSIFYFLISNKLHKKPFIILGGLVLAVISFLILKAVSPSFVNDSNRLNVWLSFLTMEKLNLVWGNGLGFIQHYFAYYYIHRAKFMALHNEYLELIAWGGLLVFGVVMTMLYKAYVRIKNPLWGSVFVGLLFNSLAMFPMHITAISIIGVVSYTLILREYVHGGKI